MDELVYFLIQLGCAGACIHLIWQGWQDLKSERNSDNYYVRMRLPEDFPPYEGEKLTWCPSPLKILGGVFGLLIVGYWAMKTWGGS